MKTDSIGRRVYQVIERSTGGDKASSTFDVVIISLIVINTTMVILESFNSLQASWGHVFRWVELISVIVFTLEYILRLATAGYKYPRLSPVFAVIRFSVSFIALVDLAAILPFYFPFVFAVDLRFLRILRLLRMLRVLKIGRYTESFEMIGRVINNKKEELLVTLFVTFLLLLLASSVMYYVETDVQPESFPNVIAAFWWAVATLTTVGYGDVYPVTILGKILSGIIAVLGIGLVALPTGIISSGFLEEFQRKRTASAGDEDMPAYCPHCGNKIE